MDGKRLKHISGLVSEATGLRIQAEDHAHVFEAVSPRAGLLSLSFADDLNLIQSHALIAQLHSPGKLKKDGRETYGRGLRVARAPQFTALRTDVKGRRWSREKRYS